MKKLLIFGETIWDVYPDRAVIGGAPFNFAANLALQGDEVHLMTGVGDDDLGEEAARIMREYGVRDDFVFRVPGKATGKCIVTLGEGGVPHYQVLTNTAYDNVAADDAVIDAVRDASFDVFYFNTLAQREPVSRASVRRILDEVSFVEIFCDINIREGCWDRDSLALCLSRSTIVKISEEEAHVIAGAGLIDGSLPLDRALETAFPNLRMLVYTMGRHGSAAYDFSQRAAVFSGEPEQVKVVSTVGEGDCFGASFLHILLAGGSVSDAIRFATERANVVVAHTEAIPPVFAEEARKKGWIR